MLSTILELAGFAALAAAAYLLTSLGIAVAVVGVEFLILGLAFDESRRPVERPETVRRPRSKPQRVVPWDEPVTNADVDREFAAMMERSGQPDA